MGTSSPNSGTVRTATLGRPTARSGATRTTLGWKAPAATEAPVTEAPVTDAPGHLAGAGPLLPSALREPGMRASSRAARPCVFPERAGSVDPLVDRAMRSVGHTAGAIVCDRDGVRVPDVILSRLLCDP